MEKDKNEDTGKAGAPTAPNPQAPAAAAQRCPGGMMPAPPLDIVSLLPKSVKRRVNALKQLQVQGAHLEAKFYKEVHELERKYAALYQPHFDKRYNIVTGAVEPTDEECEWHSDHEDEEALTDDLSKKATVEAALQQEAGPAEAAAPAEAAPAEAAPAEEGPAEKGPKGVPEFWLTIFKNVDMLSDMLQEHDEPILRYLQDIKVKFSDPDQPMSFTLEFHFEPNNFFKNEVLTKVYRMKSEPDPEDPFSFEGPEIVDCEGSQPIRNTEYLVQVRWELRGSKNVDCPWFPEAWVGNTALGFINCEIDWHKGKDVTVKTIKKKQKHKGRGTVRTITKQVPSDSFFNFFNPIKVSSDGEMDEDSELILATDFEIGHFFRERIVPHAVLYFTGEALEDDESYEEEELEEGEEEQDHEEDEDDEGDDPKKEEKQPAGYKQQ